MPIIRSRSYSVASSALGRQSDGHTSTLGVLIRIVPNGRFSLRCLSDLGSGGKILYSPAPNTYCQPILNLTDKPVIAVACGTGFGPVRSLIQRRIHQVSHHPDFFTADGRLSLFLDFKALDEHVFVEAVETGEKRGLFDKVVLVQSNEGKKRIQDYFEECKDKLK